MNFKTCKSSESLRPLLNECFEPKPETKSKSIDPMIWVLIGLAVIGAILSIAVNSMIDKRRQQIRDLLDRSLETPRTIESRRHGKV